MSTEIQAVTDFQTRMFERIRGSMGDLMTEEELKKVLETSIDKAFFQKRIIPDKGGYGRHQEAEPLFVELIREHMTPMIQKAAGEWFRENEPKVTELLTTTFKDGVLRTTVSYFDSLLQQHVWQLQQGIENTLRSSGVIR